MTTVLLILLLLLGVSDLITMLLSVEDHNKQAKNTATLGCVV